VLAPNCCCWSLFCSNGFFSAFSKWCVIVHLLVDLTYENWCTIYLFLKVDFLWWESVLCLWRLQQSPERTVGAVKEDYPKSKCQVLFAQIN
jgi:hypothetical protein